MLRIFNVLLWAALVVSAFVGVVGWQQQQELEDGSPLQLAQANTQTVAAVSSPDPEVAPSHPAAPQQGVTPATRPRRVPTAFFIIDGAVLLLCILCLVFIPRPSANSKNSGLV